MIELEAECFAPSDRFPRRNWQHVLGSRSTLCLAVPGPGRLDAAICWLLRKGCRVARMYSLAVHPDARGRGLAKSLVADSLARLPRRCTTLSLEVRPENAGAVGLYRAIGFLPSEGLAGYYGDGQDGMRMRVARSEAARILAGR